MRRTAFLSVTVVCLAACTTPHAPRVDCTKHLQAINVPAVGSRGTSRDSTTPKKEAPPEDQKDRRR